MDLEQQLIQIGDVAKLCGITRKTILFYVEQGLLVPAFINPDSGYRYFDIMGIARLQLILDLKKCGLSILEIKDYLDGTISLQNQIGHLEQQIEITKLIIEKLKVRDTAPYDYHVTKLHLPERYCICRDFTAKTIDDAISSFYDLYSECICRKLIFAENDYHFCEFPENPSNDAFFKVTSFPVRIGICIQKEMAPADAIYYPPTNAISVSHCAPYEELNKAYDFLQNYMHKHQLTPCGYPQEFYIEGNFSTQYDHFITQVVIPIDDSL